MHVLFIDICMTVSDYNTNPTVIILVGIGILTKGMFYLFIDIWMTVSDYNTNPTVIILVGIGILSNGCCNFLYLDVCIRLLYQSHSNYTSWDWNLNEMHVLFIH